MKKLSEMTNEELWEIFPIILQQHDDLWSELYEQEERKIKTIAGDDLERINHIGSTSVKGLLAKPTIDILVEIKDDCDLSMFRERMKEAGYRESSFTQKPELHIMYLKGYTEKGFVGQAFHIHVHYKKDWNELYFRDYLREHPDVCKEYEALKQDLKNKYEHHRDNYTNGKGEFIQKHTEIAKKLYKDRHKK